MRKKEEKEDFKLIVNNPKKKTARKIVKCIGFFHKLMQLSNTLQMHPQHKYKKKIVFDFLSQPLCLPGLF